MQYYTLVAGLPEVVLSGKVDAVAVYSEVRNELSASDRRALGLIWRLSDIYGLSRARIEEVYALCAASPCRFVRQWAEFDRGVRNVIATSVARVKGRSIETVGELGEAMAEVAAALAEIDVVKKEQALDQIRWSRAEAMAEYDVFGIDAVLAYIIKVSIVGRWSVLDPAKGREMYDRLVRSINN